MSGRTTLKNQLTNVGKCQLSWLVDTISWKPARHYHHHHHHHQQLYYRLRNPGTRSALCPTATTKDRSSIIFVVSETSLTIPILSLFKNVHVTRYFLWKLRLFTQNGRLDFELWTMKIFYIDNHFGWAACLKIYFTRLVDGNYISLICTYIVDTGSTNLMPLWIKYSDMINLQIYLYVREYYEYYQKRIYKLW